MPATAVRNNASALDVSLDVVDRLLDRRDLLSFFVRDFALELFFQRHHQLDGVERIGAQIVDAVRRNSLDRLATQFELVPASFGGDTVALGSALMPVEALIDTPRSDLLITRG